MRKNNGLGLVTIGIMLGVWLSIGIITYSGKDTLVAIGIIGAGICFLGFVYFWNKVNGLKSDSNNVDSEDKTVSKKQKSWLNR